MTKIIELILTSDKRGMGVDGDPLRRVMQLWTKDGILIFEEKTDLDEGYSNVRPLYKLEHK